MWEVLKEMRCSFTLPPQPGRFLVPGAKEPKPGEPQPDGPVRLGSGTALVLRVLFFVCLCTVPCQVNV